MATNDDNIVLGTGTLYIDGVDVGHIADPVTVRKPREYYDVEGQKRKGVIKKAMVSERMFVGTTLQEATLTHLKKAWDQGTTALAGSILELGNEAGGAYEHVIMVVGPGPDSTTRTCTWWRAVSIEEGAISFDKGGEQRIAVEFECLKSLDHLDANSDPLFGRIVDA